MNPLGLTIQTGKYYNLMDIVVKPYPQSRLRLTVSFVGVSVDTVK